MRILLPLLSDLRYALRTWARQPGFVAVAVLSLACGIGLNTAVFSIINAIFLQSIRGVPGAERIVSMGPRVPFTTFRALRERSTTLEGVAAWQPMGVDIRFRDRTVREVAPAVSEAYFSTLGVRPAAGRFFDTTARQQPALATEVVLDHEFWITSLDGDPTVVGQSIFINRVAATIVGIAPRAFHGFGPERPPLWMPMGMLPAVFPGRAGWEDPRESGWRVFGRLVAGGSAGQVNAELRTMAAREPPLLPDGALTGSTGAGGLGGQMSPEKRIEFLLVVVLPLVVAGLILWIGCSNVANLLLARASSRRKEMAIRLANGASRSRLVRLLLTEGLLLAVAGGALGLLAAAWTLDFVWLTLPEAPQLAIELDTHVLIYTGAVCVAATLLFGVVPALHATRVDIAPLLKGETSASGSDGRRGARVRRFFLITQFASSTALLVVTGTFVRTIVTAYLGEQSAVIDHLALARVETVQPAGPARARHWQSVRDTLLRVPDVTAVVLTPATGSVRSPVVPEGADRSAPLVTADVQQIDSGFVSASGFTVVAGRGDLTMPAHGTPEHTLVNEAAARRLWGGTDVLGSRFFLGENGPFEVSGIVRDDGLDARVFRALVEADLSAANVLLRTSRPSSEALEPIRVALANLSPEQPVVGLTTLREASTGPLARITRLAMVIAGIVLALATVGLYGAIAFVTSQRTREIAIRMAVGAPRPAVLRLVAREGILVVAVGSLLGLALIGVAFKFMSGMIFATWRLEPITVAGVLAVFALATLAACYLPGRRAMRLEPMRVLRND